MWDDPIYQISLSFSVIFMIYALYTSTRKVVRFVKKEREIDKIEEEYDRLRSHRADLKAHTFPLFLSIFFLKLTKNSNIIIGLRN